MPKTETQKKTVTERPPVVVVMGHIDHGKSTLLDYIRNTNIVDKEAGGITQHVSAYEAQVEVGGTKRRVTFLDTPGHEAFQTLRARGAKVADVAILVVSTEDGVKPQTVEAIKRIKEQNIPFIVALNKIDRPNANIDRTKVSLAENEVYVEGYGGTISSVPVSAKTGEGIPDLLELVFLSTDVLGLTGDTSNTATGVIIESKLDSRKGISATLIIKDGSIESGQFVAAGESYAAVRIVENDRGEKIKNATFSTPITIVGWSELVSAGAEFKTFDTKNEAIEYTTTFKTQNAKQNRPQAVNPDEALLPIIVKADTLGSLEAIQYEIGKLGTELIKPKIILSDVGTITEGDVKTANVGKKAYVFGFNTKIDPAAKILAERDGITIEIFSIIYKLTEKVAALLEEQRPRVKTEEVTGSARILRTFSRQKDKQIIGGKVDTGILMVGETVKIIRREAEIGTGRIRGLQQQKQEVDEIKAGTEFGSLVESKFELAVGDVLRAFKIVEK